MEYFDDNELDAYRKEFSESKFWTKVGKFASKAGIKVIYSALLLYYSFKRPETPFWAKSIITGVLGYFLSPIDFIPDLAPIIGYTDDLAMLGLGIATIAVYINDNVKAQAKDKIKQWFRNANVETLAGLDQKIDQQTSDRS
jgi:uncharacterized membrane protein YkvA (DUF1232 family)